MNEQKLEAQPAKMSGEAQRIPAIKAGNAVLHATVHVTRKATGLTETYELIGTPIEQKEPE